MLRELLKRRPRKSLSTDAKHRDGVMCSSEEGAVMALERRHDLIRLTEGDNYPDTGGTSDTSDGSAHSPPRHVGAMSTG